jgi:hypothetical protein
MSVDTLSSTFARTHLQSIAPVSRHAYCMDPPCRIHQGVNLVLAAIATGG